jgi:hypothetical protein
MDRKWKPPKIPLENITYSQMDSYKAETQECHRSHMFLQLTQEVKAIFSPLDQAATNW